MGLVLAQNRSMTAYMLLAAASSWTPRIVPVRSIWEIKVTWRFAGRLHPISLPHSISRDFGLVVSSIKS